MKKRIEEILSRHTGEEGIYLTKGTVRGSDALDAMKEVYLLALSDVEDKVKSRKVGLRVYKNANVNVGRKSESRKILDLIEELRKENL